MATQSFKFDFLEQLIAENPSMQSFRGTRANWSLTPNALRHTASFLALGMATLETGAGQSTVLFAICGTRHFCVTIDRSEEAQIRAWCAKLGVPADFTFITGSSDIVFASDPRIPAELDFVLIDGAHRFPFPILDWHFAQTRLRVGGIVAVDDYRIPSVKVLHDFLVLESEWQLIRVVDRTSFFRKLGEADLSLDWQKQEINRGHVHT